MSFSFAQPIGSGSPGLKGAWNFNDDISDGIALDISPNNLNASCADANCPVFVGAGKFQGAYSFDGIFDYLSVPNNAALNPTTAITLSAWINPINFTGNRRIIQKGDTDNQYRLLAESGVLKFNLTGVTSGSITSALPSLNQWHHIAGTFDGSTIKLYVDGVVVNQKSASGNIAVTTTPLYIGVKKIGAPSGDHFRGLIDDVGVWNRALSQTEITQLAGSAGAARGCFDRTGDNKVNVFDFIFVASRILTNDLTADLDGTGDVIINDVAFLTSRFGTCIETTPQCSIGSQISEHCVCANNPYTFGFCCATGHSRTMCSASSCGNGITEGTETCDDADSINGDGCSSTCQIETGYLCAPLQPSSCFTESTDKNVLLTSLGIPPLTELPTRAGLISQTYGGFEGGLYPNASNTRPSAHETAGISIANTIIPLNSSGTPSVDGNIVMVTIGMSNTRDETITFESTVAIDSNVNSNLVIVNGAQGGQTIDAWADSANPVWSNVTANLALENVTPAQVQIAWVKLAQSNPGTKPTPENLFPNHAEYLHEKLKVVAQILKTKYPNIKLAYFSSRTRAYTTQQTALNPELFAYENGFSVKWLIEDQINGDASIAYPSQSPWMSWGPYLWADGTNPRADGFTWTPANTTGDGIHPSTSGNPSTSGRQKIANLLLNFFKTDTTSSLWFLQGDADLPMCNGTKTLVNGNYQCVTGSCGAACDATTAPLLQSCDNYCGANGISIFTRSDVTNTCNTTTCVLTTNQCATGTQTSCGTNTCDTTKHLVGSCNNQCTAAGTPTDGTDATCGTCTLTFPGVCSCAAGWEDLDLIASNGCEHQIVTDQIIVESDSITPTTQTVGLPVTFTITIAKPHTVLGSGITLQEKRDAGSFQDSNITFEILSQNASSTTFTATKSFSQAGSYVFRYNIVSNENSLTHNSASTLTVSLSGEFPDCEEVIAGHNGDFDDRFNFVFVNYPQFPYTESAYLQRVQAATNLILSADPFTTNSNQFNFWFVRQPIDPYREVFNICPVTRNNSVRVIAENDASTQVSYTHFPCEISFLHPQCFGGSEIFLGINGTVDRFSRVFVHETGHAVGMLYDEPDWVGDSDYRCNLSGDVQFFPKSANTFCTLSSLSDSVAENLCLANSYWSDLAASETTVGCFEGCLYQTDDCWRSNEQQSYMGNALVASTYGLVNERFICHMFEYYWDLDVSGSVCDDYCYESRLAPGTFDPKGNVGCASDQTCNNGVCG